MFRYWLILAAIVVFGYLYSDSRLDRQPATAYVSPSKPAFNHPAVSVQQGIYRVSTKAHRVAPLSIRTSAGDEIYYVKLVDANSNAVVMSFFIYGGKTFEVNVPLGVYRIRYAAGKTWYGEEYRFGPDTIYGEADENFNFHRQGNQVSGYTIELILQRDGNLHVQEISADQF